eukprot:TRINITY_DN5326_c0_g2_i3.p1 TRINITY_DN5326_c0_g2~~TRINITY_DN5326_c0_g2_i3.p1  ORF type:complete len:234 (-),score=59.56 TRINITY_DN5326_c0_g2_i3:72-773(-)
MCIRDRYEIDYKAPSQQIVVNDITKEDLKELARMYDAVEYERNILREECKVLRARVSELQASFEQLKGNHIKALNERDELERHINNARAKHKVLNDHVNELLNEKRCLEASVGSIKSEYSKVKGEARNLDNQKQQLQKKVQELLDAIKRKESENDLHKKTALTYKSKALEAKRMAERLSRTQSEFFARRDLTPMESPARVESTLRSFRVADPYSVSDVKQLESEIEATISKNI